MQTFANKVAVITGAASGIGRAIAERCVDEGMKVVLADIEVEALTATAAALRAQGATVLAVPTDVADAAAVAALAEQTIATFGAVHLLCNNAGVAATGPIWERSLTDWAWVLGVNLWGVIHGIHTFVPIMLAQEEESHIVNTASIAGLISTPGLGVYNVTKHGVVTLSETLYQELQAAGGKVGVSVLCPGWVQTQIGHSARNRPEAAPTAQTTPTAADRAMAKAIAGGLEPVGVVEQLFTAIQQGEFYVLTHPPFNRFVQARSEDILQGRNPAAPGLV